MHHYFTINVDIDQKIGYSTSYETLKETISAIESIKNDSKSFEVIEMIEIDITNSIKKLLEE